MAKSASPIRLQDELMQAASLTAKQYHRSTAEQIEYWADMGRQISQVINPDVLLSLTSGLVRLKVEEVEDRIIDPDDVFNALETERENGSLKDYVSTSAVSYQVCETHPGYLEQIDSSGKVTVGTFKNGEFFERQETGD